MHEVIIFPTSVTKYAVTPSRFKQHISEGDVYGSHLGMNNIKVYNFRNA